MQQYLLSVIQPTGPVPPPDILEPVMARVGAVDQEIRDAGAWVFAGGLTEPSAATVLRADGDDVLVTDGPFAEGKEHLGGFTIVQAVPRRSAEGPAPCELLRTGPWPARRS